MGLVNRVVSPGNALDAAIEHAQEITRHPQRCMRSDRRSAIEQWGMTEEDAMRNELTLGLQTIASGETISGATRFREGVGRHGSFDDES